MNVVCLLIHFFSVDVWKIELKDYGITPSLIEYISNLAQNPDIFLNYPLEGEEKNFVMTAKQARHAELIMNEVPKLAQLRYELCPLRLSESAFWYIYFTLAHKRLGKLFSTS